MKIVKITLFYGNQPEMIGATIVYWIRHQNCPKNKNNSGVKIEKSRRGMQGLETYPNQMKSNQLYVAAILVQIGP